jgi:hypothetical protein
MTEKLSYEEFVKQAILKLRTGEYKFYITSRVIPASLRS